MPLGFSQAEAKQRFAQFGPNEPLTARRTAPLVQLLTLLTNPLAIILMVASVISAALGEVINASIIITMVLLSVALNFIQTTAASPPDVRQGYALPVVFFFNSGLGPRFGLCPNVPGQRPNRGHSPNS